MRRTLAVLGIVLIFMAGCGCRPDRSYRPVVRYSHPSKQALWKILESKLGKPYCYAAHGPDRFDCSGLVYYSYGTMNMRLPRSSRYQAAVGRSIPASQLRYGDLIFFDTHRHFRGRVNHVGIYVGRGRFVHASSSKKRVVVGSLYKPFYRKRIVVCKRVMRDTRKSTTPLY
jgi:cell wall-associated NlpC family hydrolase